MAICGNYVAARDLAKTAAAATCPDCREEYARLNADTRTAEDVFGTEFGAPVPVRQFRSTAGYRPKEQ